MPPLMDFLEPLHQGIWEVIVPKPDVTDPLVPIWKKSAINLPTPETIASYRNGQYHAHETEVDYRVHMDRYDPEKNPVMHLVDDAPLPLMIFETLETLVVSAKDAKREDPVARMADLRLSAGLRLLLGALVLVAGLGMLWVAFGNPLVIFQEVIPNLLALIGLVMLGHAVLLRARGVHGKKDAVRGLTLIAGAVLLSIFSIAFVDVLLLVLLVWLVSSAAVTLVRVVRSGGKLPQGAALTLSIEVASLYLAYLVIVDPVGSLKVIILILGLIATLAGMFLAIDGYGMRNAAKLIKAGGV